MKPVIEAQEMVELLAKKDESLLVKKSKLIDEIERLDGNTGAGSSTKELEIEVEKAEKQLLDLYSTLGQIYIDDSLDKEITGSEIDRIFSNIHSLSTENEDCNKQITKLEAAISIDQVEKDISDVNIRIDKLKNDIQEKQDEIETFAQRIKELEIEKKKQMKLRGSKDSLELQQPTDDGTVE
jgi:chromosome segregation ATPase